MQPAEIPAAEPVTDGFDPAVSRAHEIVYHVEHQLNYVLTHVLGAPRNNVEKKAVDVLGLLRKRVEEYWRYEQEQNPAADDVRSLLSGLTRKVGEP